MIRVRPFSEYWDAMKTRILGITQVAVVSHESDLADRIKSYAESDIILVSIIPSSDSMAPDPDNITEHNQLLVYILKKIDSRSETPNSFINDMEETQDIMTVLKKLIQEDKSDESCGIFRFANMSGMHTDPEYNYLGCNGWSVSFKVKTNWF